MPAKPLQRKVNPSRIHKAPWSDPLIKQNILPMRAMPLPPSLNTLPRFAIAQLLLLAQTACTLAANKPQTKAGRMHRINSNSSTNKESADGGQ